MDILRPPYIKGKNFCPNPLAVHGLPRYADSVNNPKCIGTPDYQKFYEEQLYYIKNGYTTGGITIPGRYYYFLNFSAFGTVKGRIYPDVCDLHLELAYIIDYCKKEHKNFICAKGRRKGLSEAGVRMVIDYGYRFDLKYKGGVVAGVEKHMRTFMKKWDNHNALMIPEFRLKSVDNKEEKIAQYKVMDPTGEVKKGTFNTIISKTAFQDSNVFKGEEFNDIIFEECGEFDKIKEVYADSKDCLTFGAKQYGTAWMYGTGGVMSGASKHFEEIWHDYEEYNMVRLFAPATRFFSPFYGGAKNEHGMSDEETPNLINLTDEQKIGVEDEETAKDFILKERAKKAKGKDKAAYVSFCQNNPLTIKEVFASTISNKFDPDVLNEVGFEIEGNKPKYAKWKIEFKKTEKGEYLDPLQTELKPAKDEDEDKNCVLIADDGHPIEGIKNVFSAGLDSYDQDESKTSKSLGGMAVRIRDNDLKDKPKSKVVCVVRMRPKRKEIFYEMCLKVAVHYNLVGAVLIDVRNALIIDYFKKNGGLKYLAPRPIKFESEGSEQVHEYGLSLNKFSKPRMVAMMQSDVLDNGHKLVFPKLVEELKNYDEFMEGSDNDLADAYGMSLVQDASMDYKPKSADNRKENEIWDLYNEEEEKEDLSGMKEDYIDKYRNSNQRDSDMFGGRNVSDID